MPKDVESVGMDPLEQALILMRLLQRQDSTVADAKARFEEAKKDTSAGAEVRENTAEHEYDVALWAKQDALDELYSIFDQLDTIKAVVSAAEEAQAVRERLRDRLRRQAEESGAYLATDSVWTSFEPSDGTNAGEWVAYGHRSDSWIEHDPELANYLREQDALCRTKETPLEEAIQEARKDHAEGRSEPWENKEK